MSEVIVDLDAQNSSVFVVGAVIRCRDCQHCKPTTDGRRYCALWSHIVPQEGYCWRGDYGDIADIE